MNFNIIKLFESYENRFSVFIASCCVFLVLLQLLLNNYYFSGNDLFGNIGTLQLLKEELLKYKTFPTWNFYYGGGFPVAGDPLSNVFHPLYIFIFLVFPIKIAILLLYGLSIVTGFSGTYVLSRYLKLQKFLSLTNAITYVFSGYFFSRIIAGHLEKIFSYGLIPLFIYFVLRLINKPTLIFAGLIALIICSFWLSGSIYEAYYAYIIILLLVFYESIRLLVTRDFDCIKRIIFLLLTIFLSIVFSSVKIIPVIASFQYSHRAVNAFIGAQNIQSLLDNLFFPFDIFPNNNLISNIQSPYKWWESYAYIGPLYLLGLLILPFLQKRIKTPFLFLCTFIFIVLTLFTFLDNKYNPWFWIIKNCQICQSFRIPTRMFIFITPYAILLGTLGLNYLYKKNLILKLIISILIIINTMSVVIKFSIGLRDNKIPLFLSTSNKGLEFLKKNDERYFFVAQNLFFENQIDIPEAITKGIILFNPNYGWGLKNSPLGNYINKEFGQEGDYTGITPKYFIFPNSLKPNNIFETTLIANIDNFSIFKSNQFTPFAYISSKSNSIEKRVNEDFRLNSLKVSKNEISVEISSRGRDEYVNIMQSNTPNWKVIIDNNIPTQVPGNLLNSRLLPGKHSYRFVYNEPFLKIGLGISICTVFCWVLFAFNKTIQKMIQIYLLEKFLFNKHQHF